MRNLGIFSLILSICAIVLSVAFLSTVQTVEKNQNNIVSRIESLEQAGEDPGEDPGETPAIKNYVKVVELQPGETLQLTDDMYFIDVELQYEEDGGLYTDPVDGPPEQRMDEIDQSDFSIEEGDNSFRFRYYIGSTQFIYYLTADIDFNGETSDGFVEVSGLKGIAGNSIPFIKLSENNTTPATVIIYYK